MKKLYLPKENPDRYWEFWDNDDWTITVHWGKLGTQGEDEIIYGGILKSAKSKVKKVEAEYASKGYKSISIDDHHVLLVEYPIDGFGTEEDLTKRYALQDKLDEVLGWTGLGHCDGGSIGSGTMEVCCFVVDFEIAKKIIVKELRETEFSNFTRIHREN